MIKIIFVLLLIFEISFGYLPGLDHRFYSRSEVIEVKTRKLVSKQALPFDYYSLKFCKPNPIKNSAESFGEVLFGDRIENSLYQVQMLKEVKCRRLDRFKDIQCTNPKKQGCKPVVSNCQKLTKEDVTKFIQRIKENYEAQFIFDNLPIANLQNPLICGELPSLVSKKKFYTRPDGFPIGCKTKKNEYFINNHLTFKLKYHLNKNMNKYSIVGAAVIPSSIDHTETSCDEDKPLPEGRDKLKLKVDTTQNIQWTYSVVWESSEIRWASRFDAYIQSSSDDYKVHWFSIVNSLMIVFFLTGMVAMIMLRALHKDIAFYNDDNDTEDPSDETGWKLVHGDVFRKPNLSSFLTINIGSGVQILLMSIVTSIFTILGFVSPSYRGGLMSIMLLLFVFMGIFAGYFSMRFYKFFDGEYWKTVTLLTSLYFPGLIFISFFLINSFIFFSSSSSLAVPFTTLLMIVLLWFGISLPLVFLGGYFGFKKDKMNKPTQVHKIPRQIPTQVWYMQPYFSIFIGGILPFGAVFIELYFIMSSIWLHKYYFVFGFLFMVFIILLITCAEITIVMVYFQLCNADYRWWWRSFLTPASSSIYLFLYSIFYFSTKLSSVTNITMMLVFFGYTAILCLFFFILTGTVGFFSTFWFIKSIYGSIKVE
eukprot:gene1652-12777_t